MRSASLQHLFWHTRRCVGALGLPAIAALFLFALCIVADFWVIEPLQVQITGLQHEAENLRTQSKIKLDSEQKTLNPAQQLAEFYRFFPKQDTVPDCMAKLYNAAAQQNLVLEQGEYQLEQDRDSKLVRYEIVLPVKGGYVQIRKFIAQAMADVPTLSLNGITFGRQKVDDAKVDAQIRFTLYLGAE